MPLLQVPGALCSLCQKGLEMGDTGVLVEPGMVDGVVESTALAKSLAGKYMTFKLAQEEYGLGILAVREIIGLLEITRIPRTPSFIRGVINLRGKVIPVIDLRLQFGMGPAECTDQSVIIVVQYICDGRDITTGVLVDEVLEVLNVRANRIEPPPCYGRQEIDTDFILGVGKVEDRVVFLMDISRVLTGGELSQLTKLSQQNDVNLSQEREVCGGNEHV